MSYAGPLQGLGQTPSLTTLPAQSALIVRLQTILMQQGLLSIRTADGLISSATSPTLSALQTWATNNGLSATGLARTGSNGLTIPTALLNAVIGGGGTSAPSATTDAKSAPSDVLPPTSMVLDTTSGGVPRWLPWAGGAVALTVIVAALVGRR